MSKLAVFITCQTPLKSGLPSAVRGIVCAAVTLANNRIAAITIADRWSTCVMARVLYTRSLSGCHTVSHPPCDRHLAGGFNRFPGNRASIYVTLPRILLNQ